MASTKLVDPVVGPYTVVKRRGMRRLKLSINHSGNIRITMPKWAPLNHAKDFVVSQRSWLVDKRPMSTQYFDGAIIGRSFVLRILQSDKKTVSTRLKSGLAEIHIPKHITIQSEEASKKAQNLCIKALKLETEERIVPQLKLLAGSYELPYKDVKVINMRSRWGSCSSKNELKLSCYLAQLPDELVDYVLLHELAHTRVPAHNAEFWQVVAKYDSDYKLHRRQLKEYRPIVMLMS